MPVDPIRVRDLFLAALERSPETRVGFLAEACQDDADLRAEVDQLLAAIDAPDSLLESPSMAPTDATAAFVSAARAPTERATVGHRAEKGAETVAPSGDPDGTRAGDATVTAASSGDPDATMDAPSSAPAPRVGRVATDKAIGTVIAGRYTLVEVIGQGGMGSVYRASQSQPVKRHVALKLIKTGMDSREVLARFDAERQALALMDHPNIARIYDGGVTEAGQPFFVMELVDGVPITQYCDQKRLTVKDRLELFVAACQAVQHAHQKGIIHRDLKPSNVMVTEVDGRPTPKVIDFGVAKATEHSLTDMSFADTGAIVGTPTYMSPEQANPTSMDIDTRTDIYALGVMLYELLTGSPPLDARQFQRGAILEMLRMVREVDPPRPSTKLSTADALPNIAANRSIEPARLGKLLQGELDWVVMKALEKDRTRRYDTANGFARDIQRYLADEVVEARPPSAGYRLRKFVKRHKGQVIAASLVVLTLLAGIAGTTSSLIEAKRQERMARQEATAAEQARQAEAEQRTAAVAAAAAEKTARLKEEEERKYAQAIADFVRDDFLALTSLEGQYRFAGADRVELNPKLTLKEMLDRAAEKLDSRTDLAARTEADLRWMIGVNYRGQGEYERSIQNLEQCVALRLQTLGADHLLTLDAQNSLAVAYQNAGKLPEAIALFEQVRDTQGKTLGAKHPHTLLTLNNLAVAYQTVGKLPEATALFEQVRDAQGKTLAAEDPNSLATLNNLALTHYTARRLAEAIVLFEQVRGSVVKTLGAEHPYTLLTLNNLAMAYRDVGKLPQATALFEQVRDAQVKTLGTEHPDTLGTLNNLANVYQDAGKLPEATTMYELVHDSKVKKLGAEHPSTLITLNNLAAAYWEARQLDKSVPLFERLLTHWEKKLGRDHPNTQRMVANLGVNYKDAGRLKEAIPLLEEAYAAGKKHSQLRWVDSPLMDAYVKAGENAKLANLLQEQLAAARKTLPRDSPQLAGLLAQIGMSLLEQKKWTEAEPLLRESLAIREKTQPDAWNTYNTQSMLGGALLGQKKYADAEPLLLKGYEGMKARETTIPPQASTRLSEALDRLIELSTDTDKPEEVQKWQAERAKYPVPAGIPEEKP